MAFEGVNTADDGPGRAVWEELGRPLVPALVVDGRPVPVLHVSQVASLLGLSVPDTTVTASLAWDTVTILSSWLEQLERMSWELINAPTPSRGRSIRNLTVNVFHPFELLPTAWDEARFPWDPDRDHEREAAVPSKEELRRWAERVLREWQTFLIDREDRLEEKDPAVTSPRGDVPYSVLLASQRYHAAAHHRQLVHFLAQEGFDMDGVLDVERLPDLELAESVF